MNSVRHHGGVILIGQDRQCSEKTRDMISTMHIALCIDYDHDLYKEPRGVRSNICHPPAFLVAHFYASKHLNFLSLPDSTPGAHLPADPRRHPGVPHGSGRDRDLRRDPDAAHPRAGVSNTGAVDLSRLRVAAFRPAGQDIRVHAAGSTKGRPLLWVCYLLFFNFSRGGRAASHPPLFLVLLTFLSCFVLVLLFCFHSPFF